MSRSAALSRAAAARTVAAVCFSGRSLDVALAEGAAGLAENTRAFHAQLCFGTLRHYRAVEYLLGQMLTRPLARREQIIHALLMCGLYELWQMRTPAHAAVAETVNAAIVLKRPAMRGLCNALLRRFTRERAGLIAGLDSDATSVGVRTSHPDWLVDTLRRDWPEQHLAILGQNNLRAPMWLRVNVRRTDPDRYAQALMAKLGIRSERHAAAANALLLERPVDVADLPGFTDGDVSVQDLAPQLVAPLCNVRPGMRVLDACAAPGGKAAHLLELADNDIDLLALDIDAARLQRVDETLKRLHLSAHCVAGDAARPEQWWDGRPFDRIVIDAPCTATGVIRRHPDIKLLRRASDVPALAARQTELLRKLWPLLSPGGCLLYATCSVLRAENHRVIGDFVESTDDVSANNELRDDNISGLMTAEPQGMQMLPGTSQADGFFVSVLGKKVA